MAELYARTNQKLYFAGLALDNWQALGEEAWQEMPGRIQAEREACLFHLRGAVLALCHEVLGFYRSPMLKTDSIEMALSARVRELTPSPELAELALLHDQADSWLTQLLLAYAALQQPSQGTPGRPVAAGEAEAEAIVEEALGWEVLASWRQELKALVLRFRTHMAEW